MTSRERFLAALQNRVPDRVPVTPDISTMIPIKRTGAPFWDVFFHGKVSFQKAFLDASDYFGLDCWTAGHMWTHIQWEPSRVECRVEDRFDRDRDAAIRRITFRTPDGDLVREETCFRYDPPSPTEKPIKDMEKDWKKFRWMLQNLPVSINREAIEEQRRECQRRGHAFGVGMGFPGFQAWMVHVQGGVEPLAYAEMDHPAILQEWFERDLARGDRELELILSINPEYVFFGGSGTITLASPGLAMKYAIPALKRWTRKCREAGVPSLIHSCGKNRILVDMLVEHTDMNCINPLEPAPMGDIDLAEVKRARGKQIALMGNLHTTDVMLRGTPRDVERACIQAMRDAGNGGGFILSTGDQCPRDTPEENIFAMVEAAKKYGVYDPKTGSLLP